MVAVLPPQSMSKQQLLGDYILSFPESPLKPIQDVTIDPWMRRDVLAAPSVAIRSSGRNDSET